MGDGGERVAAQGHMGHILNRFPHKPLFNKLWPTEEVIFNFLLLIQTYLKQYLGSFNLFYERNSPSRMLLIQFDKD